MPSTTMIIQSHTPYKSIDPIQPPLLLPSLVILSGINGSGKTQLLRGIAERQISLQENNNDLLSFKLVNHDTLRPNDGSDAHGDSYILAAQTLYVSFSRYKHLDWDKPELVLRGIKQDDPIKRQIPLIENIALKARKKVGELTEEDFFKYYPLGNGPMVTDMFQQNFSSLFRQYYDRKEEHEYHRYATEHRGIAEYPFLTDEEFIKIYGEPPWVLVNKIIEEANLPYYLNYPSKLPRNLGFVLKLISKINGVEIKFSDLSSGEQVIMSLALALYNSRFELEFPELLLMDEPDAHLHPSMTKQFLDVIQQVFVNEKNIKVIMTTHSPSTVALAPEESLFIMNKTEPRIIKATKDTALQIITSGVPTLSINYENRRQVFVESRYDVLFYEKVYEKLRDKLVPEISINFISSGVSGKGSCEQVKEIVNTLTGYGNRSIYGIIDWDTKNNGNEYVKVLGKGKRYSVENYIFDPVLLAAFLLREKYIDRTLIGLMEGDRYTDFSNFGNTKLQVIADFIVNQVRTKVDNPSDANLEEIEYVGGNKINLPTWFLTIQGHDLEAMLKDLFPKLNRYRREGELKREVIDKVIDDLPEFIPKEVLVILSEIQNYKVESA